MEKNKKTGLAGARTAREARSAGAELYGFLHGLLRRREELSAAAREFGEIDNTLKIYFEGVPAFAIGPYTVSGAWKEERVCVPPPEVARKYFKKEKVWNCSISKKGGVCNI